MSRYDPFEEMDRMFEQFRTRMWTPGASFGTRTDRPFGSDLGATAERHGDVNVDPNEREGVFGSAATEGSPIDLRKTDGEYVLVADLPGFEREEIDLTFDDGVLTLAAETRTSEERTTGDGDEIAVHGAVTRSRRVAERVTIPEAVLEDDISASYRNGVLEVHFPLAEDDEDDGKKIEIAD